MVSKIRSTPEYEKLYKCYKYYFETTNYIWHMYVTSSSINMMSMDLNSSNWISICLKHKTWK